MLKSQNPKRGDVIRVRLDPTEGSEQGGERPALVISPDIINAHSHLIIIAAITSKKTEYIYAFETLIEPPEGGLDVRSKVMLTQLRSIDKSRICGYYGTVSQTIMDDVENALKIATGLRRV